MEVVASYLEMQQQGLLVPGWRHRARAASTSLGSTSYTGHHSLYTVRTTDSLDALRLTDWLDCCCTRRAPAPDPRPGGLYLKPTWNSYFTFYALFAARCRRTPPLFTRVPHHAEATVAYSRYSIRSDYVAGPSAQIGIGEEEVLMGKGRPGNYILVQILVGD